MFGLGWLRHYVASRFVLLQVQSSFREMRRKLPSSLRLQKWQCKSMGIYISIVGAVIGLRFRPMYLTSDQAFELTL